MAGESGFSTHKITLKSLNFDMTCNKHQDRFSSALSFQTFDHTFQTFGESALKCILSEGLKQAYLQKGVTLHTLGKKIQ